MRLFLAVLILGLPAWAHGGSGRSTSSAGQPMGGFGGHIPAEDDSSKPGAPTTIVSNPRIHTWRDWWAYNREWYLAMRLRGAPLSGTRAPTDEDRRITRKKLRDDHITPLLLRALEDKSHHVREAAAVALGKFGNEEFNAPLLRRSDKPGERFLSTRDACLYAMGLLRLEGNRVYMKSVAADKLRPVVARSLALTSLALDGTPDSLAILQWHLNYHRSSVRFNADQAPTISEEDRRRFAAHLLGFVDRKADVNDLLYRAALGSRRWTEATQGLAITALGRRGAREYKDRLLRLIYGRDTPRAVKQSVAIALGMLLRQEDKDDIRELGRIAAGFKRYPAVRQFAVMSLARIGGPQPVGILLEHLRRNVFNDAEDRCFAYLALGLLGPRSKEAREYLMVEFERRRNLNERTALALALGLARHEPAVPLTIEYLKKAKPGGEQNGAAGGGGPAPGANRNGGGDSTRRPDVTATDFLAYGALALGLHGRPECIPEVKRILKKYRVPGIQAEACIALVLLERNAAVDALAARLGEAGSAATRASIVMALGLLPTPDKEVFKLLEAQYLRDANPDTVRALAVAGLGAIGDPSAVPMSVHFVRGYNYLIRCQALDLIARLL